MTAASRLINGDCLEVVPTLPPGSVDMVITDPPYGMGFQSNWSKSGERHKKIIGDDSVDPRWIKPCVDLLAPDGGLIMFCDWKTSCEWRYHLEEAGLKVVSQVIWDREHHGMGDLTGAFAPMHDVIWYATKGRRTWGNGRPKSVLRHKRPSPSDDNGHPTCKPVGLMVDLCRCTGGGLVLDPFMGSGSTGKAAMYEGFEFVGIELTDEYLPIAKARIEFAIEEMKGRLL